MLSVHSKNLQCLIICLSGACYISSHAAVDNSGLGYVRGAGMGGADSAVVKGAAAGMLNPAALGFMARETDGEVDNNLLGQQRFGWNILEAGASATLTGDLGDYLEMLADTDFSRFSVDILQDPKYIQDLLELAIALGNVSDSDTVVANASLGTTVQVGHFAVGIRSFGQVGGWINDVDLFNLGLQIGINEIVDELYDAIGKDGFDPSGYDPQTLSSEQIQVLSDAFGGALPDDDALYYLDYKLTEAVHEYDLDYDEVQGAVDTLVGIIESSGGSGGLLSDNTTSVTGRGFLAVEIPVSYGHAFNDSFSVGLTAKAIFGRVYGTQVWAFNEDNSEILEESLDSSRDDVALGLDAAMMYRIPKWQFAVVGYNLNSPTFDGYRQHVAVNGKPQTIRIRSVELDPQITLGAAWIPHRRLALSTDVELLETASLLNNYDVQRVSFGTEVDLSVLALRLGAYRNIAESDIGWVLTGGIGAKLFALSVDLGGAVSIDDTVNYDGTDYPRTLQLHAGVSMNF